MASTHTETLNVNNTYSVESPTVKGYVLADESQSVISGTMPAKDVTVTVIYHKVEVMLSKVAVDSKGKEVTPLYEYVEGETVRFKLSITNSGEAIVKSYTVTDTLSSELSFSGTQANGTQVSGNTLTWEVSDLAVGETREITVVTKVNYDSWSTTPQETYHDIADVTLATGKEKTMTRYNYNQYKNNKDYINCSFHVYNSQRGEVPFEDGTTQYNGGYTAIGYGRVNGIKYNSELTSIENLNSVIDTHNLVETVIDYAPNYDPGEGKVVLWYVSKTITATTETINGKSAYITHHVDGIVVDLNDIYAVTNTIKGSSEETASDIILVKDTGVTINAGTYVKTSTLTTTRGVMTAVVEDTNNGVLTVNNVETVIEKIDEVDSINTTVIEKTQVSENVVENTIENTVIGETENNNVVENKILDNVIENNIIDNEVQENTVDESVVEENNTVQNIVDNNVDNTVVESVDNNIEENVENLENVVENSVVLEKKDEPVDENIENADLENETTVNE